MRSMLRVYADFNDRDVDGAVTILVCGDRDVGELIGSGQLNAEDRVILYQDEDDFEVEALLEHRFVTYLGQWRWVALPDWTTLVRES